MGTVVNMRVEAEKWHDQAPRKPNANMDPDAKPERRVPYSIEVWMVQLTIGHY
jgi:hypothetical protein